MMNITQRLTESWQYTLDRWTPRWRLATWWHSDSSPAIQRSLLQLLAIAHQERLDTATLVSNYSDEHRGVWRYRLRRLAARLRAGMPLVDAIEQTPEVLSDQQTLAIRFATQTGTLTQTYHELLDRQRDSQHLARVTLARSIAYGVALLVVVTVVISFLIVFIFPTMKKIAEEFEGTFALTPMRPLIIASDVVGAYISLVFLMLMIALCMWCVAPVRRSVRQQFASWWTHFSTSSRSAELLRLLSLSVDAGRPISGSLSILGRYHFDSLVRRRLLFARNEVELGADPWQCLHDAKFLNKKEAEAIRLSPDNHFQAWTLRQLAEARENAVADRFERFATIAQPAIVLFFSFIVLWVGWGFIGYLSNLIRGLA